MKRLGTIFTVVVLPIALFWIIDARERLVDHAEGVQSKLLVQSHGEVSFKVWLSETRLRRRDFADFSAFLEKEGVAEVVPVWTLTR